MWRVYGSALGPASRSPGDDVSRWPWRAAVGCSQPPIADAAQPPPTPPNSARTAPRQAYIPDFTAAGTVTQVLHLVTSITRPANPRPFPHSPTTRSVRHSGHSHHRPASRDRPTLASTLAPTAIPRKLCPSSRDQPDLARRAFPAAAKRIALPFGNSLRPVFHVGDHHACN